MLQTHAYQFTLNFYYLCHFIRVFLITRTVTLILFLLKGCNSSKNVPSVKMKLLMVSVDLCVYLKVKYVKTYFIYFKDKGEVNYNLGSRPLKKQAYYLFCYMKSIVHFVSLLP